ncbi:MAG: UDP-N-acetylmuramoyl-tripeptide--D-alanyl-D-alanine ligase [Firmicutes bacterium]|nr:UDP-N-acetylmuramoyl-tripeptide--D-alanyl-D-alanine ligase [Bacillota bacterium]
MKVNLSKIAEVCSGKIHFASGEVTVTGVAIDSRQVQPGDLFVPIKGQRVDGHYFLGDAAKQGAVASFWEEELPTESPVPLLKVDSTLKALQTLGSWRRIESRAQVVAVTGSVGKTSTKDLIVAVLRAKHVVLASKGNLNTEIGLPLNMIQIEPETEYAVLEMGMRGPGQIAHLAEMAQPNIGVITNIGESHIELLGSKEAIAQAKGELLTALPADGWAVLNGDDPYVVGQAWRSQARVVYYGLGNGDVDYLVSAENLSQLPDGRIKFDLVVAGKKTRLTLPVPGKHNVINGLAAAAVAHCVGMSIDEITAGLAQAKLTGMRCEVLQTPKGSTVINDAYNACYQSMAAGLDLLASMKRPDRRGVAVLGDMLELGPVSTEMHRRVGEYAAKSGVDLLITVGLKSREIARGALAAGLPERSVLSFETTSQAQQEVPALVSNNDVVLVKGSRGMKLEEIVHALMEE